jgi:UDP-glucose 4-epimerase
MKILFTGASSFTGYWFVKELAKQGHHVVAIFRQTLDSYKDTRKKRVEDLLNYCEPIFECEFGSQKFLDLIESSTWDLFCHHAADVTNYKSPLFSIPQALASNTHNLPAVLENLQLKQCKRIILTGSVFEQNEGKGSEDLRAFSPYGLSKSFTAQVFQYYTQVMNFSLGKFIIPNPFGPYEDPRFTTYLIQNWMQKKKAAVNTPDYIRDNIHVSLLASEYCQFATASEYTRFEKISPSGYSESQGHFTQRFSREMKQRLQLPCEFELAKQTNFSEPLERTNLNSCSIISLKWDESHSWDQLADYYRQAYV